MSKTLFTAPRVKGYTIMANHHLKNKSLSLKAKGLMSFMLSTPEDWDFSLAGLAMCNKDGIDSVRQGIVELEKAGYLVRKMIRGENGRFSHNEYIIHEEPVVTEVNMPSTEDSPQSDSMHKTGQPSVGTPLQASPTLASPTLEKPSLENPTTVNPTTVIPTMENPVLENPREINTNRQNTNPLTMNGLNTHQQSTNLSNPYQSSPHRTYHEGSIGQDAMDRNANERRKIAEKRQAIKEQICYEALAYDFGQDRADEVVSVILEVSCMCGGSLKIDQNYLPVALVQEQYEKLTQMHIERAFNDLDSVKKPICSMKAYMQTVLFNVVGTLTEHTGADIRADNEQRRREDAERKERLSEFLDLDEEDFYDE